MTLFTRRKFGAFHRRPFVKPDTNVQFVDLGNTFIGIPERTSSRLGADFFTPSEFEFVVFFDPKRDLKAGDFLIFEDTAHEVITVRRFDTGKRVDWAEADVIRKDVPALLALPNEIVTSFLEQTFLVTTLGETTFTLNFPVPLFALTLVYINGVLYSDLNDYDVVSTKLTWKDVPFQLTPGDEVLIKYQIS